MADGSDILEGLDRRDRAFIVAIRHRVAREDPRLRRLVLVAVVALHVVFVVVLWRQARPQLRAAVAPVEQVMVVTFEPTPPPAPVVATPEPLPAAPAPVVREVEPKRPAAPPPVAQPAAPTPPRVTQRPTPPPPVRETPRAPATPDNSLSVEFLPADPASPAEPEKDIRLFNADGSLLISDDVLDAAQTKEPERQFVEKPQVAPKLIGDHESVPFRRTRFDKYWVPDKENLGQELVRKYPLLGLILRGVNGPGGCPERSTAPGCEGQPVPQKLESPFPQDFYEEFERRARN